MLSMTDKTNICELIYNWQTFKVKRTRKRFDKEAAKGFIPMMMRENMLDKALNYLKKVIDNE